MTGWAGLICWADNVLHRFTQHDDHWLCRQHDRMLHRRIDLE